MSKTVVTALQPPDSQRLHAATDQLNARIGEFEKALQGLNLGVYASVLILEEDGVEERLAFCKVGNSGWRLAVHASHVLDRADEGYKETLLVSTPRDTRVRAVSQFSTLYAALLDSFDAEVSRVEEATEEVKALTDALLSKTGAW